MNQLMKEGLLLAAALGMALAAAEALTASHDDQKGTIATTAAEAALPRVSTMVQGVTDPVVLQE